MTLVDAPTTSRASLLLVLFVLHSFVATMAPHAIAAQAAKQSRARAARKPAQPVRSQTTPKVVIIPADRITSQGRTYGELKGWRDDCVAAAKKWKSLCLKERIPLGPCCQCRTLYNETAAAVNAWIGAMQWEVGERGAAGSSNQSELAKRASDKAAKFVMFATQYEPTHPVGTNWADALQSLGENACITVEANINRALNDLLDRFGDAIKSMGIWTNRTTMFNELKMPLYEELTPDPDYTMAFLNMRNALQVAISLESRGELDKSKDSYDAALALAEALQSDKGTIAGLNGLGRIALRRGDSSKAIIYYTQVADFADRKVQYWSNESALAKMGLAGAYQLKGNNHKAKELYGLALDSFERRGMGTDPSAIAIREHLMKLSSAKY